MIDNEKLKELQSFIFDENEDGLLDRVVDIKEFAGRITEVYLDFDNDSKVDCIVKLEYDNLGRVTRKSVDKLADGTIDTIEVYEYDTQGRVIIKYDDNADGKVDFIENINSDGSSTVTDVRSTGQKVTDSIGKSGVHITVFILILLCLLIALACKMFNIF